MDRQSLDYQRPTAPRPIFSLWALVVMLIIGILFSATAMLVTPKFESIFKDFHTDLPMVTQWWLMFSRWYAQDYGWVAMVVGVITAPFVWAAIFPVPNDAESQRTRRRRLRLVAVSVAVCFLLLLLIALGIPLLSLFQTVSSPSKK